jgi:hypothetical protein
MRHRWWLLAVVGFGLLLGVAFRSALLAVGRLAFVVFLVAVGVAAALLVTATPAYDRTTVGVATRVLDRPLDGPTTCVACDERTDTGTRRVYVREWVVFGVPLVLADAGENDYCTTCAESR